MLKKLLFLIPLSIFSVFLIDGKSLAYEKEFANGNERNTYDTAPLEEIEQDPYDQFYDTEGAGGLPGTNNPLNPDITSANPRLTTGR